MTSNFAIATLSVSGEAQPPPRKEVGTQEPEIPASAIIEKATCVRRLGWMELKKPVHNSYVPNSYLKNSLSIRSITRRWQVFKDRDTSDGQVRSDLRAALSIPIQKGKAISRYILFKELKELT